jgi:nucleotide-binding universal stress UspA family protein
MAAATTMPIQHTLSLKKILHATDFSDAANTALPLVAALAKRYDATVSLVHVMPPDMTLAPATGVPTYLPAASEANAREDMKKLMALDILNGVNVVPVISAGFAEHMIHRLARENDSDIIIVGTRGHKGVKHLLFGSLCEDLARSAPCPVLIVGPKVEKRFLTGAPLRNILVAVDFKPHSASVLEPVLALANENKAGITFMHVAPAKLSQARDFLWQRETMVKKMQFFFEDMVSPSCRVDYIVQTGDPAERILAMAHETRADMIALGVRDKEMVGAQIRSTNTYRIIADAVCPVLTSHARR